MTHTRTNWGRLCTMALSVIVNPGVGYLSSPAEVLWCPFLNVVPCMSHHQYWNSWAYGYWIHSLIIERGPCGTTKTSAGLLNIPTPRAPCCGPFCNFSGPFRAPFNPIYGVETQSGSEGTTQRFQPLNLKRVGDYNRPRAHGIPGGALA